MDDETKIGARNSRRDQARIQDAHDLLVENGAVCAGGKSVDMDNLISFGGEIKALGDGKLGGYLVRFSTSSDTDLTGDYFTKDTALTIPDKLPVYYQHGMDKVMGKRVIGSASVRMDEVGAWVETQLNMRDEYEKAIYELAQAGKLGYSSGALPHLVDREPMGKGVYFIKSWVVGEASLTPTPAEPRNIVSLKSLITSDKAALPIEEEKNKPVVKELTMTDNLDVKSVVDAAVAEAIAKRDAEVKAAELKAAELKAAEEAGYKKAIDELRERGYKSAPFSTQKPGFSEEKDAVPGFTHWMKTGQVNGALIAPDASMLAIKGAGDAFNVTTGASGGYLVPDPLYNQIIAKRNLASWVRQAPVSYFTTDSDHILIPREVTSHTAFVLTAESAAYDENDGTVGQVDLALLKYTKMVQATEEFLAGNNSNFETWLMSALGRAAAVTENTVATTAILAGSTAGTAAASQTALTIAEVERLIGSLGAGYNIASECGFLMKNATKYYLKGVNFGSSQPWDFDGYNVYVSDDMPAMTQNLRSTLFGNFTMFAVAERPGMLIQRNPWLHMGTGEVDFFANIYRAFASLQAEAFYTMAQAN